MYLILCRARLITFYARTPPRPRPASRSNATRFKNQYGTVDEFARVIIQDARRFCHPDVSTALGSTTDLTKLWARIPDSEGTDRTTQANRDTASRLGKVLGSLVPTALALPQIFYGGSFAVAPFQEPLDDTRKGHPCLLLVEFKFVPPPAL
ncbi:hypothetical protein L218DRAFT_946746 [Marasmius fiardii PR-910]|nr:hypothetical protein L218DRAFT_946746 [Marasmius fiardii PR-910]